MMTNLIKHIDEEWHIASDWRRLYVINSDMDLANATAVCKFRDDRDNVLAIAACQIEGNTIVVEVLGKDTTGVPRFVKKGRYDVFVLLGQEQYKVVMGNLSIVHDVSMH